MRFKMVDESKLKMEMGELCEPKMEDENEKDLFQVVLKTSRYFTTMVELLPGKFYVSQESQEDENTNLPGKKKRKKKPDDKKLLAKKAKLLKLDPKQHKTIQELQEEVEKKEKELYSLPASDASTRIQPVYVSNVESTSLEELRERLHAKMEQLRGNRKLVSGTVDNKKIKPSKKKINSDKRKKQEESANIKRASAVERTAVGDDDGVKNGNGQLVYSKFDFASGSHTKGNKKKKDLKHLLQNAEKKQDKLELLQKTDSEKAEKMKKDISWDRAFQKAEGVKLKDDPTLLKKTIKRKEKQKEKSSKKWQERTETVDKQKEERQRLRKQHMKEKREEKLNKKTGKTGKTGKKRKSTPGF